VTQGWRLLLTLAAFWRRHPATLATLIVGLAMATALWSGVQALNAQARASYERAAQIFGAGAPASLVAKGGGYFPQSVWLDLRRQGAAVSPAIEGPLRIGAATFRLIGVEPLTAPRGSRFTDVAAGGTLADFILPPGRALVAPETRAELLVEAGATNGARLPPQIDSAAAPPGVVIVDIGVAQTLLQRPGQLSRLLVDGAPPSLAPDAPLRLEEPDEENDIARLTDSLHLNLTAFGGLAFLVGLFIVYSAFGLAFERRLPMLRVMLCVGASRRALIGAMLVELLILALIAGVLGMVCGYALAAALLPNVSASLDGLYGAHVPGRLSLDASWWAEGLAMTLIGALVAGASGLARALRLPAILVARPIAQRDALARSLRRQALAGAAAVVLAAAALWLGEGLAAAFLATAATLLGAALLTPPALSLALLFCEARARGALTRWFFAESRLQLPSLSLALMALLLALSTSVGVGAMVAGFRGVFLQWLDQRLIAEVYFDAANAEAGARIEDWLRLRPEVTAILPAARAKTRLAGLPVDIVGAQDERAFGGRFPTLAFAPDGWATIARGEGVLLSEQLARRLRLAPGDKLDVPTARGVWPARAVGVFPDYGNPKGQMRADIDAVTRHWPEAPRSGFSLRVAPARVGALIADLHSAFGDKILRIVDQAAVKKLSTDIFDKTFAVTAALDALTLIVSGVALFTSLSMLAEHRIAQLAPVWAMGLPRRLLAQLELLRIVAFAACVALAAIPLGAALEWMLVAQVNVRAFGWRLPFGLFPAQWLEALAVALIAACLAAAIPLLRLARAQPATLLKAFANEN
jgi:putative ABC transport system permease protein